MVERIDYPRNDMYRSNYLEALEPWGKGLHEKCVEAAKYNLTDPTLPRYFQIKNRILIVLAEHDWAVAERFRVETERIYAEAVSLTKAKEVDELRALAGLRAELDAMNETHGEDPALFEGIAGELADVEIKEESSPEGEAKTELDRTVREEFKKVREIEESVKPGERVSVEDASNSQGVQEYRS